MDTQQERLSHLDRALSNGENICSSEGMLCSFPASLKKPFMINGAGLMVCRQGNFTFSLNMKVFSAQAGETVFIPEAAPVQCDVSDFDACGKMMEMIINNYGHLDILVNNAGVTRDGLIMKMSEKDFDRVLDTNLKGAFHTIRHASRYFLKQKSGKIINISSVSGVMGNAGQANYSASKAGVIGLTKSVARELASRGITCNAVAPGFIETEMTEAMPEAARETVKKQIPLQRTGQVSDVAGVAAFLASDLADYITGQVISVDGGMHM